jgi:hypothetical protein
VAALPFTFKSSKLPWASNEIVGFRFIFINYSNLQKQTMFLKVVCQTFRAAESMRVRHGAKE